jgi:hypothetical protein
MPNQRFSADGHLDLIWLWPDLFASEGPRRAGRYAGRTRPELLNGPAGPRA